MLIEITALRCLNRHQAAKFCFALDAKIWQSADRNYLPPTTRTKPAWDRAETYQLAVFCQLERLDQKWPFERRWTPFKKRALHYRGKTGRHS
jgi:hypothetical protein